jgi:hypothetical protein
MRVVVAPSPMGIAVKSNPGTCAKLIALIVAAASMSACGDLQAQCIDYNEYAHWLSSTGRAGASNAVAITGQTACIVGGYFSPDSLQMVDISDPSTPTIVSSIELSGDATDVAIAQDCALVVGGGVGLQVYDISDSVNPFYIRGVAIFGTATHIDVAGRFAYVACRTSGLQIYDVITPRNPTLVGMSSFGLDFTDVDVSGAVAYVADMGYGLRIVDLSDIRHPTQIGGIPTQGDPRGVAFADGYAFVADGYGGFKIVDVTTLDAPWIVSHVELPSAAESVTVSGAHAVVTTLYDGCQVIDISDVEVPVVVGALVTAGHCTGAKIVGGVAYVTDRFTGMHVFDVESPTFPETFGSVHFDEGISTMAAAGGYLYTPLSFNLKVIDVSDPRNPVVVGDGLPWSFVSHAAVSEDRLCCSYNYSMFGEQGSGVNYADVSDPLHPTSLGHYILPDRKGVPGEGDRIISTHARGVGLHGVFVLLAAAYEGFQLIDFTDPRHPYLVWNFPVSTDAWDLVVEGDLVYCVAYGELLILDVSDPLDPVAVSSLADAGGVDITKAGSLLYVASGWDGIKMIDVSDPGSPFIVGRVPVMYEANIVVSYGETLYENDRYGALQIFDISDPAHPRSIGSHPTYLSSSVVTDGEHVYIASDYATLEILPAQCGTATPTVLRTLDLFPLQDAVSIRWQVATDLDAPLFRLTADDGARQWDVPYATVDPRAVYAAEDRSQFLRAGVDIVYTLSISEDGATWTELGRTSTALTGPPDATRLLAAYPNPFNPRTTIRFECREPGQVRLAVHDLAGRQVALLADTWMASGQHELTWEGVDAQGRPMAAGPYFVRLRAGDRSVVKRVMLVR